MRTDIKTVYHLGAPNTDHEKLTWSLRKDSVLLAENGVMLRRPKHYRSLLAKMIEELQGEMPSPEKQETLLNAIIRDQKVDRLIMTNSRFLGVPAWMFYGGAFYKQVARNTTALRNLFPNNPCEFFLGIANPASFIPAAFNMQSEKDYHQFMDGIDLETVCWSDVVSRIQTANPDCPITVWCNEDTPVIWPTILREIAGLDPNSRLKGELDVINEIMSEEGVNQLAKYLDEHPEMSESQRRQVRAAFLEKFFLNDAIEEEADLPGWTEDTVETLTELYEDDVERIEQMSGVNFISV